MTLYFVRSDWCSTIGLAEGYGPLPIATGDRDVPSSSRIERFHNQHPNLSSSYQQDVRVCNWSNLLLRNLNGRRPKRDRTPSYSSLLSYLRGGSHCSLEKLCKYWAGCTLSLRLDKRILPLAQHLRFAYN